MCWLNSDIMNAGSALKDCASILRKERMTLRTWINVCLCPGVCQLSSFYLYLPWTLCDVELGLVGEEQRKCDVGRLRSCGWGVERPGW